MTPDPTPQPDHGSAGFCGNHAQPPDERTEKAVLARARASFYRDCRPMPPGEMCCHGWDSAVDEVKVKHIVAALDDETARLQAEVEREARRADIAERDLAHMVGRAQHHLDRANTAEAERDSAQEHLAYHLRGFRPNASGNATGDLAVDMAAYAGRLKADLAAARAALDRVRALAASERGGRLVAGESADRFRDVLAECLGYPDENPGDEVLVAEVRAHFGQTGPEPHRWRDFCAGALATLDQIHAMPDPSIIRAALAAAPSETTCGWCGGQQHDPGDCAAARQVEAQRLCDEDRHYAEDETETG